MFDISLYFDAIVNWVDLHPQLTLLAIFFIAFLESLVVIGVFMPGAALMVAAGVLVSMGKLSFGPTATAAIIGAIMGDGFSFWIGYHYKDKLRKIWPFSKSTSLLTRGEEFFKRHGGKSIVLGRFVGPVRAIIPTIAGMLGMSRKHFTLVNVLSAIAWAPIYMLPGLIIGAISQAASESGNRLVLMVFLLLLLLFISHWLTRKLFNFLQARTEIMVVKTLSWGQKHPWFKKYTQSLLQPESSAYRALVVSTSLLLLASLMLIALFSFGIHIDTSANVNSTINHFFRSLRSPGGDQAMTLITMLADPVIYGTLLISCGLWLGLKKNYQALFHLLFVVGLAASIVILLKHGIGSIRPNNDLLNNVNSGSFPSAHTTMAVTIYGFIAVLIANGVKSSLRSIPYVISILLIILIAFSRLYLGVHWFSDVLGGVLIGIVCLSITGISYQRHLHKQYSSKSLAAMLVITLCAVSSVHLYIDFDRELKSYTPIIQTHEISKKNWLNRAWQQETAFRYDLRSRKDQPLNLQFAGDINKLRKALTDAGWQQPAKFKLSSIALWLQQKPKLNTLPVLPQVHDGQHEQLLMIKQIDQKQYVIRLWHSNKKIIPDGGRLFVGNSSNLRLKRQLKVFSYPETGSNFLASLTAIKADLPKFAFKQVYRLRESNNNQIKWGKRVLLISH